MLSRPAHRQILLLASAQALFQTVSVLVMTVGGLAGAMIAPRPEFATMPIAAMFLGTAVVTFPAAMGMTKYGRRLGFVIGALLGAAGGLIGASGIWFESLILLSCGTFLVGAYQAFAQFYRFAASEVADEAFRPRAISLVLGGGIVAALAGPLLARFGGPLFHPEYMGSFLLLALVSAIAAAALLNLRVPPSNVDAGSDVTGRNWTAIVTQPSYLVALFGGATGYGIMILAMTATPIAMVHHHHELSSAATVIQLHVLGMFLPSFFTGSLIARFGVVRVMLAGVALLTGHVMMTLTGVGFGSFAGAPYPFGCGLELSLRRWNDALDYHLHSRRKRTRTRHQRHDYLCCWTGVFVQCRSAASDPWLANVNTLLLPWLALAALALLWLGWRKRRLLQPAYAD